jgi:hypothetical protein
VVTVVPAGARPRRVAASTALRGERLYLTLGTGALALAALSLLLPSTPSYDSWAWLIWGREIVHLGLHTSTGPSWKPLPVLFTTAFAPLGAAQPDLWLVVARAGALMAVAMVFRLAYRVTRGLVSTGQTSTGPAGWAGLGPALLAGLVAAASLINSGGFIVENALGYSEGLAIALMLIAVERFLDGARRQAFVAGFLACLDRPELWFVWVPFGAWLWWRDPGSRRLVLALFVLTPVPWFLPELWGSGQLFRGVARAHHPNPGTPAFSHCPLCTVFDREAWPTLMRRVKLPAILALALAAAGLWRARGSWWRASRTPEATRARLSLVALGAAGFLWWLGIAAETQAGFAGNRRYLELGTALVAITGGVAWGWIASAAASVLGRLSLRPARSRRPRPAVALGAGLLGAVAVLVGAPPWIGRNMINLAAARHALSYQAGLRSDLAAVLARSGGAGPLVGCGTVMTEAYQVPMVAWTLGLAPGRVKPPPSHLTGTPWPDVILQDRAHPGSALLPAPGQIAAWEHAGARYGLLARTRSFTVYSTCTHRVGR